MKTKNGEKFNLMSVEELLGVVNEESAMDIEISKISGFEKHPFKVLDDEKMQELVVSIRTNGVLSPVLIRPKGNDTYEMISGHRRLHAAQMAGLTAIPAIIRELSDDEATIAMVDANIQREELLPSEKAWAYKMKMDAMRKRAGRPQNNLSQNGTNYRADQEMAEQVGESRNQIRRYIRLTELIPDLLDYVDKKRLQFTVAVEISYIDKEIQTWLFEYIKENGQVNAKQVAALREALKFGPMTQSKMIMLLNVNQPGNNAEGKVSISEKRLREYFPDHYSTADMRDVILELLKQWKEGRE